MKKLIVILIIILSIPLVLAVENQSASDASNAILQAELDIQELVEAGFNVVYFNDTLIAAKEAFKAKDYALVLLKTKEIADRKIRAYNISDSLRALELRILEVKSKKLNTSEAENIYNKAIQAFKNETYDNAENFIFQANKKLSDVEAEATTLAAMVNAARENIFTYIKENWQSIMIIIIIGLIASFISYNKIMIIRTKHKIKDLRLEKKVLINLMKKAQIDHYQKGIIPAETYRIKMAKYRERMIEIKEMMPVLKARLGKKSKKIFKLRKKK